MAQKLFSETLEPFTGNIENTALSDSIYGLKSFLGRKKINYFKWSEHAIAFSVTVPVELPPLGNFEDIDIGEREPILIVADVQDYPAIAPAVYPDRLDFPKDQLAHLYIAVKGRPPGFCLVRGSLAEWYANKRLSDLCLRVSNWLRDAAAGLLSEDGDQFDPVRMQGHIGSMIYDYDQLVKIVNHRESAIPGGNFAIAFFEKYSSETRISFKFIEKVTAENLDASIESLEKEKQKPENAPSKKYLYFGYILWSDDAAEHKEYMVDFPDDWNKLKKFCAHFGISTTALENQIAERDLNTYLHIPVLVGIRRPKTLIGFSGDIEFFHFSIRVDSPDVGGGIILNNVPVVHYAHAQPLRRDKAERISGSQVNLGKYALIAGCGALGSKIVMHFARSGNTDFVLADPDDLSPHNLVRHALLGNSEGLNKAEALVRQIQGLYPHQKLPLLLSGKSTGSLWISPKINQLFNWILDFTASYSFGQSLATGNLPQGARVAQAFITDFGNMGVICFEGKDRNPRVDDLRVMMYAQSAKHAFIREWLQREAHHKDQPNNLSITVGVGCNSETTVLADDVVSLHAAYASAVIKSESQQPQLDEGRVYLNQLQHSPFFAPLPHLFSLSPMEIFTAINDPGWQIRMRAGLIEQMKKEMGWAMPRETGGVFVGCANYKTKVIHVTGIIKAPPDSKCNEVCFFRGVQGLPDAIREVNEATGNQLGYIGEWHTHPFGPNQMSVTDAMAIKKHKKEFNELQTPLPVFMMIITPTHILPYVY